MDIVRQEDPECVFGIKTFSCRMAIDSDYSSATLLDMCRARVLHRPLTQSDSVVREPFQPQHVQKFYKISKATHCLS